MTTLLINGQTYFCPCDWTELKWSQFIALKRFDHSLQKRLRTQNDDCIKIEHGMVKECEQHDMGTDEDGAKEIKLLTLFCGVDPETAFHVDPVDRKQFVRCLIRRFIDPVHSPASHQTIETEGKDTHLFDPLTADVYEFRCGDESLCLPVSGRTFEGASIPLCDVSAVQWCEAADLYLTDKWEYAPVIAAVLCKGEEPGYIERIVKRRAESLRDLSMGTILILFNALNEAHRKMMDLYPECYTKKSSIPCSFENTLPYSWNDLLLWTGHFRADEIEHVRSMNCYDFMALVSGRIKSGDRRDY